MEALRRWLFAVLLAGAALLQPGALLAGPVAVRHAEGLTHGFLVLRDLDGKLLADGDLIQVAHKNQLTKEMVFHFKDGSVYDETTIFSQRGSFRLLRYHAVQKGPAFNEPLDFSIDASSGRVTSRYTEHGKEKVATERLKLPPDIANGLVLVVLKNIRPDALPLTLPVVAATPKPRLVKLVVSSNGEEPFLSGGSKRKATHYVVKVEIGGFAGVVAPLLGKQPPDSHIWIAGGDVPAFVKADGALYTGGPIWRIELTSPVWPSNSKNEPGAHDSRR